METGARLAIFGEEMLQKMETGAYSASNISGQD
jgi:hypothetical protein